MKIDFLCPSGSPTGLTPRDIHERGVGGAELALLTLAPILASRGHDVSVYNAGVGIHDGVRFLPPTMYAPNDERDAVVLFRVPDPRFNVSKGRRIFWSCDQYTTGNYKTDVVPFADEIVTISPRHSKYFEEIYGAKSTYLDLGVRVWEYPEEPPEKVPDSMIFCSVPDRGLSILFNAWPYILDAMPERDPSLVITSDYTLWGAVSPGNVQYRVRADSLRGITFRGKVSREELIRLQLASEIMAYPCIYDELFCISAAECQVAGAVPVTSNIGALDTTNRYGLKLDGHPSDTGWEIKFAELIVALLTTRRKELQDLREMCYLSRAEFDWNMIATVWEGILSEDSLRV